MMRLLTAKEVAILLNASPSWVYHQAESGKLPSRLVGGTLRRFLPEEIKAFVEGEWLPKNDVLPSKKGRDR
jgi:excisionase family DNA binding protein